MVFSNESCSLLKYSPNCTHKIFIFSLPLFGRKIVKRKKKTLIEFLIETKTSLQNYYSVFSKFCYKKTQYQKFFFWYVNKGKLSFSFHISFVKLYLHLYDMYLTFNWWNHASCEFNWKYILLFFLLDLLLISLIFFN